MSGIRVKHKYFTSHKTITDATKKGSQMLVESINRMHETNLVLEEKQSKFQKANLAKQLDYFKSKNNLINETQMNMVRTITSLIEIMNMVLKLDKGKKIHLFKKNYHEQ
jgi:Skp family chaperone for outer membrane proteins